MTEVFFNNLLFGLAVTAVVWIVLLAARTIGLARLRVLSNKTTTDWDDLFVEALERINGLAYGAVAIYAGAQFAVLPPVIAYAIDSLTFVIVVFSLAFALQQLLVRLISRLVMKGGAMSAEVNQTVEQFVRIITKSVLWALVVVLILQNLGYEVGALLGGLGIVGLAIGFAIQNILGDILGFFSIYFDKPFAVGDFIVAGEHTGTIEKVGLKTTRMRSLQGEEIVVSNKTLTDTPLHNFKHMEKRRTSFSFGVVCSTPVAKLRKIPQLVQEICESIETVEFSRAHFTTLNNSSLDFEVVYLVNTRDFVAYRDAQHSINLQLIEKFAQEKIDFAYPTQTVFVAK